MEAKEIVTSYHANNLSDDELVEMEFQGILASIRAEKGEKNEWLPWLACLISTLAMPPAVNGVDSPGREGGRIAQQEQYRLSDFIGRAVSWNGRWRH